MHFTTSLLTFTALALFAGVNAQTDTSSAADPSGTAGISACIIGCTTQSSSSGCPDITDVTCVCTNTDFQAAVVACIQQQCPDELADAQSVQQQQCAALSSASGAESTASSAVSSASSAASSVASSLSSAISSASTRLSSSGSVRPTSTSPSGSASGSSQSASNPAISNKVAFGYGGVVAVGVAVVGALAGGALVL